MICDVTLKIYFDELREVQMGFCFFMMSIGNTEAGVEGWGETFAQHRERIG